MELEKLRNSFYSLHESPRCWCYLNVLLYQGCTLTKVIWHLCWVS